MIQIKLDSSQVGECPGAVPAQNIYPPFGSTVGPRKQLKSITTGQVGGESSPLSLSLQLLTVPAH